jgi:hypothetical protein
MASKPNPSWSEPQKRVFKDVMEAMEIVIPYSGAEIPSLDNHSPEQICDDLGVVKAAKKAIEKVEKILTERFKPRMGALLEMRGTRYIATKRLSERTALDQGKVKELLVAADNAGLDLDALLTSLQKDQFTVPDELKQMRDEDSNTYTFYLTTDVSALYVEPI